MSLVPIIQYEIDRWIQPVLILEFVELEPASTSSLNCVVNPDSLILDITLKWIVSAQTLY